MTASLYQGFAEALASFDSGKPILILTHNDADGLSAGAILARAFDHAKREWRIRILGRGENPWSDDLRAELGKLDIGGLIVADLGLREGAIKPGTPTIIIDHHVPTGGAGDATVISGFGEDPIPTTSLLAWRCAAAIGTNDDLLWLAAIGLIGDLGEKAPFEELAAAKKQHTAAALREATSLVNAPRRTGGGHAQPAFDLLMKAAGAKDALSGRYAELDVLKAAREEVKAALEIAKRAPPRVAGDVALISLDTPCQVHPLVAQAWRMRLKDKIVIAANHGYRQGWIHFATRSATGRNLIAFLRDVAPANVDENYGNGHEQATGGALRTADWPTFLRNIGFGEDGRALSTKAAA